MALNFTQLTAFAAVAEAGSVGGGAEKLMVSQPAVSKQIKELERFLETRLFERTARGVKATEAGKVLQGYARRIFGLMEEAEGAVEDLQHLRRGRLRIGATPTIGTYFLPEVLVRFRRKFPGVSLALEVESSELLVERVAEGQVEFGLSEAPAVRSAVESSIFMHDQLVAIAPRRHALAGRGSISLARLCREPMVVRQTTSGDGSLVERALAERGMVVNVVLAVGSTEAVKRAVAAGMGVAIVSGLSAEPELAARRVVRLGVKGLGIRRPLYYLRLGARRESKAAHALMCIVHHAARGLLRPLK